MPNGRSCSENQKRLGEWVMEIPLLTRFSLGPAAWICSKLVWMWSRSSLSHTVGSCLSRVHLANECCSRLVMHCVHSNTLSLMIPNSGSSASSNKVTYAGRIESGLRIFAGLLLRKFYLV